MEKDRIAIILCMVVIIILIVVLIDDYRKGCDSCKMYAMMWNKTKIEQGIGGYYSSQGFYCVWTEGLTAGQIADLDEHEKCHALIEENYKHFCEVDDV